MKSLTKLTTESNRPPRHIGAQTHWSVLDEQGQPMPGGYRHTDDNLYDDKQRYISLTGLFGIGYAPAADAKEGQAAAVPSKSKKYREGHYGERICLFTYSANQAAI